MELLFDDMWIDRQAGVRRVLGVPRKAPQPIFQTEGDEGGWAVRQIMYDADEKMFKLWYIQHVEADMELGSQKGVESSERARQKRRSFLCYALSDDGLTWTRPQLGLFEFKGGRANNILTDVRDCDTAFCNIVKDNADPDPNRRYKAVGFDFAETANLADIKPGRMGVCVRYSPDGLRWPGGPKLVMDTSDLTDADNVLLQREPNTGKWVGFFRPRTHPKRRYVGYSESDDWDHWTYPRMLFTPDALDDEFTEFYGLNIAVLGRWRVGCLWVFHNNPQFSPMTVELVYSRDGIHYHRAMPRVPFIPHGPVGAFDSRMISTRLVLPVGNEVWFYYGGSNSDHGSDRGQDMPPGAVDAGGVRKHGLGLARLDGWKFCGLKADLDGMVESKWLTNYGEGGVQVYADIEPDGSLQAEILDQYGNVIPGWDRSRSRYELADDGRLHFSWGKACLTGMCRQESDAGEKGRIGHVVKLRFHLHKATLYGFQIGEEGAMPPYAD